MAYVASHGASRFSFAEFAARIVASVKEANARRRVYNTTLSELHALSDRDLLDLGIAQSQIQDIAYEAAYGK